MSRNDELLACYKVLSLLETASQNSEIMLDNIPGVVVVLNQRFQVIRANQEFADLCACNLDNILGFDFISLFSPENANVLLRQFALLTTERESAKRIDFELEITPVQQTKGSRQFFWQSSLVVLPHIAEGDLISITGKDLSDLYQSEMKLKNIFANLPLGMLIIGPDGRVSDILSQFSEFLFDCYQLIGLTLESLLKDAERSQDKSFQEGLENYRNCFGQNKSHYDTVEKSFPRMIAINHHQGAMTKWLNINYQPILKLNRVDGFILMIEDATDTVQARKEIERVSALERQILAMYETAIRDPLTGLYTRLFMKDSIKSLISSFHRGGIEELSVLMLDIDFFKSINDTYGHKTGDMVLAETGKIILDSIRGTDVAIRYGGEEFLIILPSNASHMTSAKVVAERIRTGLEEHVFRLEDSKTLRATISGGAAWCQRGENLNITIERADSFLYQAKRTGRNRIVTEGDGDDENGEFDKI